MTGRRFAAAAALALGVLTAPLAAQNADAPAAPSRDDGLAAWSRIEAVVTHPRCANCHVGPDNIPMWTGPEFDRPGPHGMAINAGESRIGAETLACATCHVTSDAPNEIAHAAPHVGIEWRLAPVEFQWFDVPGADICDRLRDPATNGGRDAAGLVEHLRDDVAHQGFVLWGWQPGGDREPAPGTLEDHIRDMGVWGAAGQPCPGDAG